jgi:hypothetical protein
MIKITDKHEWLYSARYYRIFYRRIANIVDLRSMKATLVPPGWISTSPFTNRTPSNTPNAYQLVLLALMNSFIFDWNLRLRLTATLNLFIIKSLPIPALENAQSFASHLALRLTCNHAGYASLWREQLWDIWREPKPPFTWPVLAGDDERWATRAAIDAVVANAYGLAREQYAHILSTFSHKSYPKAPELCLARFDELQDIGLEAFTRKHDPYWDIPLNDNLPQPIIDLPIPLEPSGEPGQTQLRLTADPTLHAQPQRRRSRRVS